MNLKDLRKELRKDWRYRFWEIVLWLPETIKDLKVYWQIKKLEKRRNK